MGLIRKLVSGTAAAATGGLSLGVIQFRSDTERGTRQTKLLRQELERQYDDSSAPHGVEPVRTTPTVAPAQASNERTLRERLDDLARLAALRDSGVLTAEEFESAKADLMKHLK